MKAKLNPVKHLYYRAYWWWHSTIFELNPGKTRTFWEWLNANDLALCTWGLHGEGEEHTHDLVQLGAEETEAVFKQYLQHYHETGGV